MERTSRAGEATSLTRKKMYAFSKKKANYELINDSIYEHGGTSHKVKVVSFQKKKQMGIETRCRPKIGCLCTYDASDASSISKSKHIQTKLLYEQLWQQLVNDGMIACICLQERDDRFLEVSEQFHEYGLCRLVEFYRPSRPSLTECEKLGIQRRGGYGVWSSHRHVILKTLQHKLSRCLTFEDDAVLFSKRMSVSKLEQMINDVDALEENWGAFKLGHCAQIGYFVSPSVVRTWSFLTQAVLWSQTGMEKLRDCTYVQYYQRKGKEGEIDCWMMGAMNMYATFPQLVHQSDSDTNNLNSKEDDAWYRDKIMKFQRQILNKCNAVADIAAHLVLPVLIALLCILFLKSVVQQSMKTMTKYCSVVEVVGTNEAGDNGTTEERSTQTQEQ
jgi:hypothetical protein